MGQWANSLSWLGPGSLSYKNRMSSYFGSQLWFSREIHCLHPSKGFWKVWFKIRIKCSHFCSLTSTLVWKLYLITAISHLESLMWEKGKTDEFQIFISSLSHWRGNNRSMAFVLAEYNNKIFGYAKVDRIMDGKQNSLADLLWELICDEWEWGLKKNMTMK